MFPQKRKRNQLVAHSTSKAPHELQISNLNAKICTPNPPRRNGQCPPPHRRSLVSIFALRGRYPIGMFCWMLGRGVLWASPPKLALSRDLHRFGWIEMGALPLIDGQGLPGRSLFDVKLRVVEWVFFLHVELACYCS